jgi:hypothetical protein
LEFAVAGEISAHIRLQDIAVILAARFRQRKRLFDLHRDDFLDFTED